MPHSKHLTWNRCGPDGTNRGAVMSFFSSSDHTNQPKNSHRCSQTIVSSATVIQGSPFFLWISVQLNITPNPDKINSKEANLKAILLFYRICEYHLKIILHSLKKITQVILLILPNCKLPSFRTRNHTFFMMKTLNFFRVKMFMDLRFEVLDFRAGL